MVALRPRFNGPEEPVPLTPGLEKLWAADVVVTRPLRPVPVAFARLGEPAVTPTKLASWVLRRPSSSSESDSSESGTILESAIRPRSIEF